MTKDKTRSTIPLKNKTALESLTNDIFRTGNDLKYSGGIQLVYTGLLMSKYADLMLSKLNLNIPRILVLFTLTMHGGALKPKELAELLFRSKQNISVITEGLLKNGLVSKQLDPKDKRSFTLVITRKGLDLAITSLPIFLQIFTSSLGALDEDQIHELKRSMRVIRKTLYKQLEDFGIVHK